MDNKMLYSSLISQGLKSCSQNQEGDIVAIFSFFPESEIFKGHFPDNPILPGVAQLEAVKYLIGITLSCKCTLQQASSIKFFQPILPNQEFTFVINYKNNGDSLLDVRCKGTTGQNNTKSTEIIARYKIDGATQEK